MNCAVPDCKLDHDAPEHVSGFHKAPVKVVYHLDDSGWWVLCESHAKSYPDNPTSEDFDGKGTPVVGVEYLLEGECDKCGLLK